MDLCLLCLLFLLSCVCTVCENVRVRACESRRRGGLGVVIMLPTRYYYSTSPFFSLSDFSLLSALSPFLFALGHIEHRKMLEYTGPCWRISLCGSLSFHHHHHHFHPSRFLGHFFLFVIFVFVFSNHLSEMCCNVHGVRVKMRSYYLSLVPYLSCFSTNSKKKKRVEMRLGGHMTEKGGRDVHRGWNITWIIRVIRKKK